MKKTLFIALLFIVDQLNAQTNVSGGIFSNTTWLKVNSPYIVTSNVVVFPGFILTIQPGVLVKFDSGTQLEIRQAGLIANGTSTDSITFTSSSADTSVIYQGVYLNGGTLSAKFNYCNFRYANTAINTAGTAGDTLIVKNSNINFNKTGTFGSANVYTVFDSCNFRHNINTAVYQPYGTSFSNCDFSYNSVGIDGVNNATVKINNCTFMHNQTGIKFVTGSIIQNCKLNYNQTGIEMGFTPSGVKLKNSNIDSNTVVGIFINGAGGGDSIIDCQIRHNPTGISDDGASGGAGPSVITRNIIENGSIGIELRGVSDTFYCNKICNNSLYGLKYVCNANTSVVSHNYWCTADSAATQVLIYDAHNNVSYGLVNFMPIDSSCFNAVGIESNVQKNNLINMYPNPSSGNLTIQASVELGAILIYNSLGEIVSQIKSKNTKEQIDVSKFSAGIYTVQVQGKYLKLVKD